MSGVTCQVCHVKCVVSSVTFGEANQWRVFYQWGLPHLVFLQVKKYFSVVPIRETLRYSFVSYTIDGYNNISNGIFGFPKVAIVISVQPLITRFFWQGSHFLEFVLSAAREHFMSPDFKRKQVWEKFGPSFLTTAFVRKIC